MLFEHVWAADLRDAISDAGGEFLAQGYLTPEVLFMVGAELEAQVEAAAAIEAAEIIKTEAALVAADVIEEEAADEAAAAILAAEIVEDAAVEDAVEVEEEVEEIEKEG